MAGRGPVRKPDDQRARTNKDYVPLRVVEVTPSEQPLLPTGVSWHPQTLVWWTVWGESELSEDFTAIEWNYLTETAMIVNEFWNGDMKMASELRLRAAKFGATPEDRARLRIQVVTATVAEDEAKNLGVQGTSRARYEPPKAV